MRSAKLQASVSDLEAQVSQLQGNCHHQVRHAGIQWDWFLLSNHASWRVGTLRQHCRPVFADLEAQVSQLPGSCQHQVRHIDIQRLLADTSVCYPASSHGVQSLQANIRFCDPASSHGIQSLQADISFWDPACSHAVGRPEGVLSLLSSLLHAGQQENESKRMSYSAISVASVPRRSLGSA